MAIFKIVNERPMSLEEVTAYVASSDRIMSSEHDGVSLIGGIADSPDEAYERMNLIKILWNKPGGREYIHIIMSPEHGDKEDMSEFCKRFVKEFLNYGCFYGIHQNTDHVHAHFILNSVGFDGKKFSQSRSELAELKKKVELIWDDITSYEDIEFDSSWEEFEVEEYFDDEDFYDDTDEDNMTGCIDPSYVPNINDAFIPQVYRKVDNQFYPVLPFTRDGKPLMGIVINPETDIMPMICIVDNEGNLIPSIREKPEELND